MNKAALVFSGMLYQSRQTEQQIKLIPMWFPRATQDWNNYNLFLSVLLKSSISLCG